MQNFSQVSQRVWSGLTFSRICTTSNKIQTWKNIAPLEEHNTTVVSLLLVFSLALYEKNSWLKPEAGQLLNEGVFRVAGSAKNRKCFMWCGNPKMQN